MTLCSLKPTIRSVTLGLNPSYFDNDYKNLISLFLNEAANIFGQLDMNLQTKRIVLPPNSNQFCTNIFKVKSFLDSIIPQLKCLDIDWICLPIDLPQSNLEEHSYFLSRLILKYPKLFLNFLGAQGDDIHLENIHLGIKTILKSSKLSRNGYDNFRIGIGANVQPNTPYFPFSFHEGQESFSLAVEFTEIICELIQKNHSKTLKEISSILVAFLCQNLIAIDEQGKALEAAFGLVYKGVDISMAPYPKENKSVSRIIELIGPKDIGQNGSLFAISMLTNILKSALEKTGVRYTGFNGVMLSVLEDQGLAEANNHRQLDIDKLLLYSTVCGCGIDMVPVPGDVFEDDILYLFLDIAALSLRLKKPLGMRVLPIPSKQINEFTSFNHSFLTNTRVMKLENSAIVSEKFENFSYLNTHSDRSENRVIHDRIR